MRISSLSSLAGAGLLALLGCPLDSLQAPSSEAATTAGDDSAAVSSEDTASHDDAVDRKADVSWVDPSQLAAGSGALRMLLTDAPIAADNVFVTICGISVARASSAEAGGDAADAGASHPTDAWYTISDECQTLDLLTLQNGVTEAVGLATVPAGEYGQIRLVLTDASIVVNGLRQALRVPSGSESGVKLVGHFTVGDGEATTLTVDFDAGESVQYVEGQGFALRPVLRLLAATEHAGEEDVGESAAPEGSSERRPGAEAAAPERDGSDDDVSDAGAPRPREDDREEEVDDDHEQEREGDERARAEQHRGGRDSDEGDEREDEDEDAEEHQADAGAD